MPSPSGGLALHQLLSQIPALQESTYLDLDSSCQWYLPTASVPQLSAGFDLHVGYGPPATAYAMLSTHSQQQAAAPLLQEQHTSARCLAVHLPHWLAAAAPTFPRH